MAERLLKFTTVKIRPPRIGFLVLLALISSGHPPASGAERDFRELEEVVRAELQETNTPGAVVAIVSGDRVIYEKGFGVADVESGAPVTAGMLFRSGSIGKMLTASVLLALLEEHKIPTDAPLEKAASGLAPRLSRLTFAAVAQSYGGADLLRAHLLRAGRECAGRGGARLSRRRLFLYRAGSHLFLREHGLHPGRLCDRATEREAVCGCDAGAVVRAAGDDAHAHSPDHGHDLPACARTQRRGQGEADGGAADDQQRGRLAGGVLLHHGGRPRAVGNRADERRQDRWQTSARADAFREADQAAGGSAAFVR